MKRAGGLGEEERGEIAAGRRGRTDRKRIAG